MIEVDIDARTPDRLRAILTPEQFAEFQRAAARTAEALRGVTVWNVNSTAKGGGVAEMLTSLVAYARGGAIDARWLVIDGGPEFFEVTKRIHNRLHGSPGDGEPLDERARRAYEEAEAEAAAGLAERVSPGDVVVLHDPQTAGLAPAACRLGARVVWRCHVGTDVPNELSDEAWGFLQPYLAEADLYVFSRAEFVWRRLDPRKVRVIPPSIDAFSAKNRELDDDTTGSILSAARVLADGAGGAEVTAAEHGVVHQARMVEDAPAPPGVALVVQVSRWDGLKDPKGVIDAFATHIVPISPAHLIVAGPSSESVSDDPEGAQVLGECIELRSGLEPEARSRVHLACLPMQDAEENALIVNALQRRADVVVQKSLAEGFGLTVAEAMWKGRPVVASRVGGIQDQIEHGRTGLLLDDPLDTKTFADLVCSLLLDPDQAEAMGAAAREAVRERFVAPRHLLQYAEILVELTSPSPSAGDGRVEGKPATGG
jgi:trehalose synthase